jgi:hypothetical protein
MCKFYEKIIFFFETDSRVWDNITNYPPQEKKLGYGVWRSGIGIVYRGQKEITYKNNTV